MLKDICIALVERCGGSTAAGAAFWAEIESNYSSRGRHYHTLYHLENMYRELSSIAMHLSDFDAILFALFYHDIVYSATSSDNEAQSALLASRNLVALAVSPERIDKISRLINATQRHEFAEDQDINYFTDADLAILGADWQRYSEYTNQIRKEYSVYPDLLYKPGRRKVLHHFLAMERIYKTAHFSARYEAQARANLASELELL